MPVIPLDEWVFKKLGGRPHATNLIQKLLKEPFFKSQEQPFHTSLPPFHWLCVNKQRPPSEKRLFIQSLLQQGRQPPSLSLGLTGRQ